MQNNYENILYIGINQSKEIEMEKKIQKKFKEEKNKTKTTSGSHQIHPKFFSDIL